MRQIGRLLGIAGFVATALAAERSDAFERQWHAGGGGGIGVLDGSIGPSAAVHGAYGLSDMFDLHLELLASRHSGADGTDVFSASGGMAYKIDILEWVPYVVATAGYYNYAGLPGPSGEEDHEFGASVGVGVDYLFMRELAAGAQIRQHTSFSDGLSFPYVSAVLLVEYRWGW